MKKPCLIRILDEVNCVFLGIDPADITILHKAFAIRTENYFFDPKYQVGPWDGRIPFFLKTGKTYVHLLDEIIPKVLQLGYRVAIDDHRRTPSVTPKLIDENYFKDRGVLHPITGEPWMIRDYQVEMVNTLLQNGGGVGVAGTGAGKTSMTAALALSYEDAANYRSIIIVPDKFLTAQTYANYENFTLDVGQYGGGIKDGDHQHVVSTWQTLQNHKSFLNQFQVIVVDECHGLRGKVLKELLIESARQVPFRFGVTGSMPKGKVDAMSVKVSVGPVKYEIPAWKLQEMDHLAKLHIDIMQHEMDLSEFYQEYLETTDEEPPQTYALFRDNFFASFTEEKKYLQKHPERLDWIAEYIITQHELGLGNVLCLVTGIPFGKRLAKRIPGSIFLSGGDEVEVRKEAYDLFAHRDDVTVIATVNIAGTGLDIPRIFHLIGIDMGKSFTRTIQSIGRGLRKAEDKDKVIYTDICSDLKYSRQHLTKRKKYFREQKYKYKLRKVKL